MDLAFSSRGLIVLKSSSLDYFYASENEDNKIESNQGARVTTIEGLEFEKYFLTSDVLNNHLNFHEFTIGFKLVVNNFVVIKS